MESKQSLQPSAWVLRFANLIPNNGTVLDVACGAGRHASVFAAMGCAVVAVDRDPAAFVNPPQNVTLVEADLELQPWPFAERTFGGVVVTNYLHRPLLPRMVSAVARGGVLIYETFAAGNEQFGRPSRADFLLQVGELLDAVRGELDVIAYENIFVGDLSQQGCSASRPCDVHEKRLN